MKKSIELLQKGFESSSFKTPEFILFARTFRREFTKELQSIEATEIIFSIGHFYVSGFFTVAGQPHYFSLSDVRGSEVRLPELLYRRCKDYKDFIGSSNRYADLEEGMALRMVM